jgi:hypothetical protein
LDAILSRTLDSLQSADKAVAMELLTTFESFVQSQSGKTLSDDQANRLVTAAEEVIQAI